MRIRYKKWARPELEASSFYEDEPEKWKGNWKEHFDNKRTPLMLELGCGKGQFISKLAVENQNVKTEISSTKIKLLYIGTVTIVLLIVVLVYILVVVVGGSSNPKESKEEPIDKNDTNKNDTNKNDKTSKKK